MAFGGTLDVMNFSRKIDGFAVMAGWMKNAKAFYGLFDSRYTPARWKGICAP